MLGQRTVPFPDDGQAWQTPMAQRAHPKAVSPNKSNETPTVGHDAPCLAMLLSPGCKAGNLKEHFVHMMRGKPPTAALSVSLFFGNAFSFELHVRGLNIVHISSQPFAKARCLCQGQEKHYHRKRTLTGFARTTCSSLMEPKSHVDTSNNNRQ